MFCLALESEFVHTALLSSHVRVGVSKNSARKSDRVNYLYFECIFQKEDVTELAVTMY